MRVDNTDPNPNHPQEIESKGDISWTPTDEKKGGKESFETSPSSFSFTLTLRKSGTPSSKANESTDNATHLPPSSSLPTTSKEIQHSIHTSPALASLKEKKRSHNNIHGKSRTPTNSSFETGKEKMHRRKKRRLKVKRKEKEDEKSRKENIKTKSKKKEKKESSDDHSQYQNESGKSASTPMERCISPYHLQTPVIRWSEDDVARFLHSIGLERIEKVCHFLFASYFISIIKLLLIPQAFRHLGVDGFVLSLLNQSDFTGMPITREEVHILLSNIQQCKKSEYEERQRREAVNRMEDWLRENKEELKETSELHRCLGD